jgi:hypothetical protein
MFQISLYVSPISSLYIRFYDQHSSDVVGLRESKRSRNRLSDHATQYLLGWFEEHVTSPYPTKEQKEQIANATGLTTKQVRNWYVNLNLP